MYAKWTRLAEYMAEWRGRAGTIIVKCFNQTQAPYACVFLGQRSISCTARVLLLLHQKQCSNFLVAGKKWLLAHVVSGIPPWTLPCSSLRWSRYRFHQNWVRVLPPSACHSPQLRTGEDTSRSGNWRSQVERSLDRTWLRHLQVEVKI